MDQIRENKISSSSSLKKYSPFSALNEAGMGKTTALNLHAQGNPRVSQTTSILAFPNVHMLNFSKLVSFSGFCVCALCVQQKDKKCVYSVIMITKYMQIKFIFYKGFIKS